MDEGGIILLIIIIHKVSFLYVYLPTAPPNFVSLSLFNNKTQKAIFANNSTPNPSLMEIETYDLFINGRSIHNKSLALNQKMCIKVCRLQTCVSFLFLIYEFYLNAL